MRPSIRSRLIALVRAQWAGLLALFLVIAGGTAYAANTVSSTDIVDGQVKTVDLANAAVITAKVAEGAVTSSKVLDGTLAGRDVLDDSLKGSDIDESTLSGLGSGPAEAWHTVAAGSSTGDRCADASVTAVFCSDVFHSSGGDIFFPWHNYGGAFASAAFYKDQVGVVHLKGLVGYGNAGGRSEVTDYPIFRLPADYRPDRRRVFASVGGFGDAEVVQGRVDVQRNGLVTFVQGCGTSDGDVRLQRIG